MKKIISIVLFVISVAMIGFGFYTLNSNKYIFEMVLSKSLNYMVDGYYSNSLILDDMANIDKYKIITDTNLQSNGETQFSIDGDLYISNNKFYLDLDSNIVGKKFIGLESLVDSNRVYLKLKEAMDKFYYFDLTESDDEVNPIDFSGIVNLEKNDFSVLTNHLKKSIVEDLKNDDFDKNSETLTLDNKRFNTNRISLGLSGKEIRQIIINLLENISNDNKAIQVLQKIDENITKEDITNALNSFKEVTTQAVESDVIEISFYISGVSDVLRIEIITLSDDVDTVANDNLIVTIDNYKNNSNNQVMCISLKQNNLELMNITNKEIDDYKSNVEITINDGLDIISINGTYSKNSNNVDMTLDLLMNNTKVGDLVYKVGNISKNKEYRIEMNISSIDDSLTFSSVNNIYLNENIPNIDISDSDNIENITETEIERIQKYISDKLTALGLEDYLSSFENNEDYVEESGYSTLYYDNITVEDMKKLIKSETPVVIWFGSQTCSYCISFSEVLDDSYWDYYYDINYIDITTLSDSDFETLKYIDSKLDIEYTPTVMVLQNGKVKDIKTGTMDKDEYYDFLDDNGVK